MEGFKPNSEKEDIPTIFKKDNYDEITMLLECAHIVPEDLNSLAELVVKNSEILFDTYHNLFQFQEDKSASYIALLRDRYSADQQNTSPESVEHRKLQFKIDVATAFIAFIEKYGWHTANNTARTLEEVLV